MKTPRPIALKPRKTPRQARSEATVETLFEASIQVLRKEGARRLTTTRVAERAGVSVGTLYQYFPHKQALLYAVLKQHLEAVAQSYEAACVTLQGQPLQTAVEGLVKAFLDAKTARVDISQALYLVAAELDTTELLGEISKRLHGLTTALLASIQDAAFADASAAAFMLRAAMTGTTRAVFERGATPAAVRGLRTELVTMCVAYLRAVALEKAALSR